MTKINTGRSSVRPTAGILENDPGYRLVKELDFNDMIPFVLTNIRRRSIISTLFAMVNLGMMVFIVWYLITGLIGSQITWQAVIRQSLMGIFSGSVLVVPLHEILHGLAYWVLGAKKVKFGVDFQQFIFFVTADRYPVSKRELCFLAMTPFLLINLAAGVLSIALLPHLALFIAFMLLSHNVMCIGDFALVNFVLPLKGRIFSFDKPENKKSYFYEEITDHRELLQFH